MVRLIGLSFITVLAFSSVVSAGESIVANNSDSAAVTIQPYSLPASKIPTLRTILSTHGFNWAQMDQIFHSDAVEVNFPLAPNSTYLVLQYPRTGRIEVKVYSEATDLAYIFWREDKDAGVEVQTVNFDIRNNQVEGSLGAKINLNDTITRVVKSREVAKRFSEAYIGEFNIPKDLKKHASYSFLLEEKYDHGVFIKFGNVVKAALEVGGQLVQRVFVKFPEGGGVFAPKAFPPMDRPFYAPIEQFRVTSQFQLNRLHPITHRRKPHLGIDIGAAKGIMIFAPRSGVVKSIGFNRTKGRFMVLKHDNGFSTAYIHLSKIAKGLRVGTKVTVGDVIAAVGCTGQCTRSHLHFGVSYMGMPINPLLVTKRFAYSQRHFFEGDEDQQLASTAEHKESSLMSLLKSTIDSGNKEDKDNFEDLEEYEDMDEGDARAGTARLKPAPTSKNETTSKS